MIVITNPLDSSAPVVFNNPSTVSFDGNLAPKDDGEINAGMFQINTPNPLSGTTSTETIAKIFPPLVDNAIINKYIYSNNAIKPIDIIVGYIPESELLLLIVLWNPFKNFTIYIKTITDPKILIYKITLDQTDNVLKVVSSEIYIMISCSAATKTLAIDNTNILKFLSKIKLYVALKTKLNIKNVAVILVSPTLFIQSISAEMAVIARFDTKITETLKNINIFMIKSFVIIAI